MQYQKPSVKLINVGYEKVIKLTRKAMQKLEKIFYRVHAIEKWVLD